MPSLCRSAAATDSDSDPVPTSRSGTPLYFHNDVDYGSDSEFDPVQATIQLSYDILRSASYQDHPLEIAYATGFENVARNLASPFDAIANSTKPTINAGHAR